MRPHFLTFKRRWTIQGLFKGKRPCALSWSRILEVILGVWTTLDGRQYFSRNLYWVVPVEGLSFKTRVHIPTEILARFMFFWLNGSGGILLNRTMTQWKIQAYLILVCFIAFSSCVLLQVEGKTHYLQKDFNLLYCNIHVIAVVWN